MRPRWWAGRGATGAAVLGLGLATAFVAGPTAAAAGSGEGDDIVSGALAALRDNAAVLGFDTDGHGAQGLGKRYSVVVTDVIVDPDGSTFVRMDRAFAGLPVYGGDFVVHRAPDGRWVGASATLRRSLDSLGLAPAVSAAAALETAGVGRSARVAQLLDTPRLVVDARHGAPALAWDVRTAGTQPDGTPSRLHTLVDAVTGHVRATAEEVQTLRRTDQPPPDGGDRAAGRRRGLR